MQANLTSISREHRHGQVCFDSDKNKKKIKKMISRPHLVTLLSLSSWICIRAQLDPWWNSSLSFKARAEALISELTIIEKLALLDYDAPEIARLGIPSYNYWSEGTHGVAFAGVATVFPSPLALAATFNVNFASR